MSLFNRMKSLLTEEERKGILSDSEMLLLGRKDYQLGQLSPTNALLEIHQIRVGYAYRMLLALLESYVVGLPKDEPKNIIICDPTLTMAAYYVWLRSGGEIKVYAPKGRQAINSFRSSGFIKEVSDQFNAEVDAGVKLNIPEDRRHLFTYVLGNTKSALQTSFAIDRYLEVKQGLLTLKDYGRLGAFDNREFLEEKQIFINATLEGHGYHLRLL